MAFDPSNPFGFNNWEHTYEIGAGGTGDDAESGNADYADANDATIFYVYAAENTALGGINLEPNHAGVGVWGESVCTTYGIGTGGLSATGVGVYGISQTGLGVVGRVMGSEGIESDPLEAIIPQTAVLGHSVGGVGVRGHGGIGFRRPPPDEETRPRPIGGTFSAGDLLDVSVPGAGGRHEVSVDSLAQMRLIPSRADALPKDGRLGDMFLSLRGDLPARLFICTKISGSVPMWQQVAMGTDFIPSGSPL